MTGEEDYVFLDGEQVKASLVTPKKHRFIGMFRPPVDPAAGAGCYVLCRCGQIQKYVHEAGEHYRAGHWDVPQYVTIRFMEE